MQNLLEACRDSGNPFSLQLNFVGGLYRFLESISPIAMQVEGLQRFVESVFTALKLVANFWRFVDSVLNIEKHVRSM